jgi:hypothetical protein
MQHGDSHPVKQSGTLGSFTHREALPIVGSKQERFHLRCFHPPANPIRSYYPDWFIASHRQHVRISPVLQPGAQIQVASIDGICHHSSNRYLGIPNARQHASGQFRLGLEVNRLWDTGSLAPIAVLYPIQGQVEFAVNERMPSGGDIREKDAYLTILDLARRSTILEANACRLLPLLGKTGFVDDHNSGLVAERLKDVRAQIIAHPIGIPDGSSEQTLHPIRASLSGVFGQLPAVFARGVTEDAVQKSERTTTRFGPSKARSDPCMQAI